ncbi:hypothetical protein POSPLADRAFT_1138787, partial [Postia placenta MAD-698-R-SB12]
DPRGQERARKLGRASSRGPEAPIVVYNDPARCTYRTRLSLTGIATPVDKRAPHRSHRCSNIGMFGYGIGAAVVLPDPQTTHSMCRSHLQAGLSMLSLQQLCSASHFCYCSMH